MKFDDLVLLAEKNHDPDRVVLILRTILDYLCCRADVPEITTPEQLRHAVDEVIERSRGDKSSLYCKLHDYVKDQLATIYKDHKYTIDYAILTAIYANTIDGLFSEWIWYFDKIKIDKELKNNDHGMDLTF